MGFLGNPSPVCFPCQSFQGKQGGARASHTLFKHQQNNNNNRFRPVGFLGNLCRECSPCQPLQERQGGARASRTPFKHQTTLFESVKNTLKRSKLTYRCAWMLAPICADAECLPLLFPEVDPVFKIHLQVWLDVLRPFCADTE